MTEKVGKYFFQLLLAAGIAVVFFCAGRMYAPFVSSEDVTVEQTTTTTKTVALNNTTALSPSTSLPKNDTTTVTAAATTTLPTTTKQMVTQPKVVRFPLCINTATKEELMEINGIGEHYANAIIAYREQHDGFRDLSELMEIKGIGPKRYAKFAPFLSIS